MTTIIAFALKYWKYLLGALIIVSLYLYHSHLENVAYDAAYEAGRQEILALNAKEDAKTAKSVADAITAARLEERTNADNGRKLAQQQLGEIENEKKSLQLSLDSERTKSRRLRSYIGKTTTAQGVPEGSASGSQPVTTCTAQLPAELGEGFQRLREYALRIGSACNEVAITHNKAIEERAGLVTPIAR